jgi:hypothetical protein
MKINSAYELFIIIYLLLNSLNEKISNKNLSDFLDDADPYIWDGENSADPACYLDFKSKFEKNSDDKEYYYDFVCNYLKNIEYYKNLYDLFTSNYTKEDYINTCKLILNNKEEYLKK